MKLELKHLAPYLPYGLTFKCTDTYSGEYEISTITEMHLGNEILEVGATTFEFSDLGTAILKPILRPLSDLFNEYPLTNDYEGWESEWIEHIWDFTGKIEEANILACPYNLMQDLLSKHFDVFGLIHTGLAIDVNTIK